MQATSELSAPSRGSGTALAREVAAMVPAAMIGFTALVDPFVNFGLARGVAFGGVVLEAEKKTQLAQYVMPLFLVLALALAALARPKVTGRLARLAGIGIAFLALACASAAWAQAPDQTFRLAFYQTVLFGSLLVSAATARDPDRMCRWVLAVFALTVAVNLAALVAFPPGPIGHRGIYQFKNTLGAAGGCAFLFALFYLLDARRGWRWLAWITFLGAVTISVASDSKTALALMVAAPGLAIGIVLSSKLLRVGWVTALALIAAFVTFAAVLLAGILGAGTDDALIATYGDTTFTGRTHIWGFALEYAQASPWFGNGYRGFWSLGQASPKHGSEIEFIRTIGSGHSGFVDIRLDLGWIGVALLVAFIVSALAAAGRLDARPTSRSLLYFSVIAFATGRNAMESVILWSSFFDNLAFLLVACLACQRETVRPRSG